jgi:organic hydroperoxide reductase OsmC/OhrA
MLFIEDPRDEHAAFQTRQEHEHPGQLIAAGHAACDTDGSPALLAS